ncbi:hypothetical protein [Jannaschia sp. R86511]|uniref:hypothetical protein n=1 Tax=Jannaschia sp. R86511 TaxID=3093853 RepID=UPI0036D2BFEA
MAGTTPDGFERRAVTRTAWLALWTTLWTASLALARFGPGGLWQADALTWGAVGLNVLVGLGWVVAFTRYLSSLDELQRALQLAALAVTLGAGWVLGFALLVVDQADLLGNGVDVAVLPVAMAVVFVAAVGLGHLRYR